MPVSTSKGHKSYQVPVVPAFDPKFMQQAFAPFMGAVPQANTTNNGGINGTPFASWLKMNQHWSNFLMHRLQEDADLVHRLARCSDPGAISQVYAAFFKTAPSDDQSEFAAMTSLSPTMFGDAFKALPDRHNGDGCGT
ncbi:MAG: hypothetical protein R3D67_10780 [Hyphomicrobiaceae bacterium]